MNQGVFWQSVDRYGHLSGLQTRVGIRIGAGCSSNCGAWMHDENIQKTTES